MDNGSSKALCQGKDVFERMNFLYQASRKLISKDVYLSSFYGDMLTKCSKKAVLRLGTDIKRSICKKCQSPLIPGQTAKVRLKSKPSKCVNWHCLKCGHVKKYPYQKGYKLWSDNPEATIHEYNYGSKKCAEVKNNDNNEKKNVETNQSSVPDKNNK